MNFSLTIYNECWEIIVYSWSTINAYSLLSHEWWVPLIKFMVGPTKIWEKGVRIYGTLGVSNNFPKMSWIALLKDKFLTMQACWQYFYLPKAWEDDAKQWQFAIKVSKVLSASSNQRIDNLQIWFRYILIIIITCQQLLLSILLFFY